MLIRVERSDNQCWATYLSTCRCCFLASPSAEVSCLRTTSREMLCFLMMFCKTKQKKTTLTNVLTQNVKWDKSSDISHKTRNFINSLKIPCTHKTVCQVCQKIFHRNHSIAFSSRGERIASICFIYIHEKLFTNYLVPSTCIEAFFSLKNTQTIISTVFMSSLRPLVFTIADLSTWAEPVVVLHMSHLKRKFSLLGEALRKGQCAVAQYRHLLEETRCVQL